MELTKSLRGSGFVHPKAMELCRRLKMDSATSKQRDTLLTLLGTPSSWILDGGDVDWPVFFAY